MVEISFQKVKNSNPKALELLSIMSFRDVDAIPKCLLVSEDDDLLDFSSGHWYTLKFLPHHGECKQDEIRDP